MTDQETISRLARMLDDHGKRIGALEAMEAAAAVSRANMSDNLKSIQSDIRWLIRLVIGALLLGIIAFAMQGGFAPAEASEVANAPPPEITD
jgi:hypothetical protein